MKGIVSRIGASLPSALTDIAGLAGAGLVAYGSALVYEPAGYIAGGALLLTGAVLRTRRPVA